MASLFFQFDAVINRRV